MPIKLRSTIGVWMGKADCRVGVIVIEELSHGTPLVAPRIFDNSLGTAEQRLNHGKKAAAEG